MDAAACAARWLAELGFGVELVGASDQREEARRFIDMNHHGGRQQCAGRFEQRPRPSCRVD
eukprot:11959397-Alexandrium_andersonii.AAC.1